MSLTFKEEIAKIINTHNLNQLNPNEAPAFYEDLTKLLKKINASRNALSMEWIKIDARGRVTIPENYRLLLGFTGGVELECHLNNSEKPTYLILRKSF